MRGVAALLFGGTALLRPDIGLAALLILFGVYAFVDGALTVVSGIAYRRREPHWVGLLIGGIGGMLVGVVTFLMPEVNARLLLFFIATWAVVTGVAEILAAIRLRKSLEGEWLLGLIGLLSIGFGMFLFLFPGRGALAMLTWIGLYALVLGVMLTALALRLRKWREPRDAPAETPEPRRRHEAR